MLLILLAFYYQAFYEGDIQAARYTDIRVRLESIQAEITSISSTMGSQNQYSFRDFATNYDEIRQGMNEISEDRISTIDKVNKFFSSLRSWIFIAGSLLLIAAKHLQFFWHPKPEELPPSNDSSSS
ncbi:hypothetical protein [Marinobacter sp.]|uniref:hypothetical protein n=1 Tax=Marinobacter sp. TaxID=50741 RepID=UPI003B520365